VLRTPTALLSDLSDRLCAPLAAYGAEGLAKAVSAPIHFVEMLLLIEDKRFIVHFGVDPVSIVRALVFDLRGGALQGGSTIPQQLYNVRAYRAGAPAQQRTLGYKFRQSAWAISCSAKLSKVRILAEYVAYVYFGRSYFGLDKAAKGYFCTPPCGLSVEQSFFLAERIAAPNRILPRRIANLLSRRAIIKTLKRHTIETREIVNLYESRYGCGAEICQFLEK
jgi:membrane peptidoglycan carboxypeptidase